MLLNILIEHAVSFLYLVHFLDSSSRRVNFELERNKFFDTVFEKA